MRVAAAVAAYPVKDRKLKITDLITKIAILPEAPARTVALEQEMRVGTGFHGKWYRSQKEHWLGFLGYRLNKVASDGGDFGEAPAKLHWNRLHCFPMLFWLAECAGVPDDRILVAERAGREVAEKVRKDHPSHGKALRSCIEWSLVEAALRKTPAASPAVARNAVRDAYGRLARLRPAYDVGSGWFH